MFFVILGTVADALGVISFLGIQASRTLRISIALFLFAVAVISAGSTLKDFFVLWLSPRGSYYPRSFHMKRVTAGIIVVLAAVGLGIYVVVAVTHEPVGKSNQPQPHRSVVSSTSANHLFL